METSDSGDEDEGEDEDEDGGVGPGFSLVELLYVKEMLIVVKPLVSRSDVNFSRSDSAARTTSASFSRLWKCFFGQNDIYVNFLFM